MSYMEVFSHPISDERPDEAIMLYTDITSFNLHLDKNTATYEDDFKTKEAIFNCVVRYHKNLGYLKGFNPDLYENSIFLILYYNKLYNAKFNYDWGEFLNDLDYQGMPDL